MAKPSQVYFGGNIVGESAMKSEDNIGNLIEYEFRVSNLELFLFLCVLILKNVAGFKNGFSQTVGARSVYLSVLKACCKLGVYHSCVDK